MKLPLSGRLWRHPDFLKLWGGQTISRVGSEVTLLAVPTVAILVLHAGPFQVGLLGMLEYLSFPTLGLIAGVYADRLRRRPIMIACDVGRAVALGSIPLAYLLHGLTLVQLYAVALAMGLFTVFFDVAYQSYLPALIDRSDLVEGNTKLTISYSSARLVGPALAGALIQLIGGARAVALNSASFLVSALAVWRIRKPEPDPSAGGGRRSFFGELREGVGVVFGNSILWHIADCTATANLGYHMIEPVFLIFAYRRLYLTPAVVGVVFAIGSLGFLLSALIAGGIARRTGVGPALATSILIGGIGKMTYPLAFLGPPVMFLALASFLASLNWYDIIQVSLRQAITPDRLQGRMNATMRTVVWGTIPVGYLVGGVLGSTVGVVQTILLGGAISILAAIWIVWGPVIRVREQPAAVSA